jgi:hypothetical protein
MSVVVFLVFVSLVLVGAALAFFVTRMRGGDFDHGDRLSLLPLSDDDGAGSVPATEQEPAEEPAEKEDGQPDASC